MSYIKVFEDFDQTEAAKMVEEQFPFISFRMENGAITSVDIGGNNCWFQPSVAKPGSIGMTWNGIPDSYQCPVINNKSFALILRQLLMQRTIFQTHYMVYEMQKSLEPLVKKIDALHTMISCAPGGSEYQKAEEEFRNLSNGS